MVLWMSASRFCLLSWQEGKKMNVNPWRMRKGSQKKEQNGLHKFEKRGTSIPVFLNCFRIGYRSVTHRTFDHIIAFLCTWHSHIHADIQTAPQCVCLADEDKFRRIQCRLSRETLPVELYHTRDCAADWSCRLEHILFFLPFGCLLCISLTWGQLAGTDFAAELVLWTDKKRDWGVLFICLSGIGPTPSAILIAIHFQEEVSLKVSPHLSRFLVDS